MQIAEEQFQYFRLLPNIASGTKEKNSLFVTKNDETNRIVDDILKNTLVYRNDRIKVIKNARV